MRHKKYESVAYFYIKSPIFLYLVQLNIYLIQLNIYLVIVNTYLIELN